MLRGLRDDDGSAVAEFVMVGGLPSLLTLSVMQLGLALHIRNTVRDAAAEGAARQAVRVFVQSATVGEAQAHAERAIRFGLKDYGLDAKDATVSVSCAPTPADCLTRLGTVTVVEPFSKLAANIKPPSPRSLPLSPWNWLQRRSPWLTMRARSSPGSTPRLA